MYIHIHIYIHIHLYKYTDIHIYIFTYIHIYICLLLCRRKRDGCARDGCTRCTLAGILICSEEGVRWEVEGASVCISSLTLPIQHKCITGGETHITQRLGVVLQFFEPLDCGVEEVLLLHLDQGQELNNLLDISHCDVPVQRQRLPQHGWQRHVEGQRHQVPVRNGAAGSQLRRSRAAHCRRNGRGGGCRAPPTKLSCS